MRRNGAAHLRVSAAALPAELQQIGASTNQLLLRLSEALDTQKFLAANAANERRTPLATVCLHRLQDMELAPAVRDQAHSVDQPLLRLSRRAEKLLQLSR